MNKHIIMFFAISFELVGNYIPTLLGDNDWFSLWSVLGGIIGGVFGIWLGVLVSKRFF